MTDIDRVVRRLRRKEREDFSAEVQADMGAPYPLPISMAPAWIATERGVVGYGVTADHAIADLRANLAYEEAT